ncbi:hypothetical protein QUC31_012663 [Theobroma cacao]
MPDSKVPADDDGGCPPCNNLLSSPPPRRPEWEMSLVYRVKLSKSVSSTSKRYFSENLPRLENKSLKKITLWYCKSSEHIDKHPEIGDIRRSFRREIFSKVLQQVGKSVFAGGIEDGGSAMTDVVVKIHLVQELGSLRLLEDREEDQCALCLEGLSLALNLILPCWHMYHRNCILPWLRTKQECPVCRHHLPRHINLH